MKYKYNETKSQLYLWAEKYQVPLGDTGTPNR